MNPGIPEIDELLRSRFGLEFLHKDELGERFAEAAAELGFADPLACFSALQQNEWGEREVGVLAARFTVSESYFFREKRIFELLEEKILPEILNEKKRLKIWSAGCATGEEPYSLAILLMRLFPGRLEWKIIGTDVNLRALDHARRGVYRKWSLRGAPDWLEKNYFTQKGDFFELLPQVRENVTFAYHNLARDPFSGFSGIDLIFCRNVFMYLGREATARILAGFHRALIDGGWLIVDATEVHLVDAELFLPVSFPGATLFRKGLVEAQSFEAPPAVTQPVSQPVSRRVTRPRAAPVAADAQELARLAKTLADRRDFANALIFCERAILGDKLNAAHRYLHAMIMQETGRIDEAVDSLRAALYLDEKSVPAHVSLAALLEKKGEAGEAKKHYRRALRILADFAPEDEVPGAEGMSAGRMSEAVAYMLEKNHD